jgi:hypothetical protein
MLLRGMGQRPASGGGETDIWATPQKIREVFDNIGREIKIWREEAKSRENKPVFPFLSKRETERFEVLQTIPPRLLRIFDPREGEIVFELTEIKDNGTSVKVTYNPAAKSRVQTFRAKFPAEVFSEWKTCSSCGKPVVSDFNLCPYCGGKLREEKVEQAKP